MKKGIIATLLVASIGMFSLVACGMSGSCSCQSKTCQEYCKDKCDHDCKTHCKSDCKAVCKHA